MPVSVWVVVAAPSQILDVYPLVGAATDPWLDVCVASIGVLLIALAIRKRRS